MARDRLEFGEGRWTKHGWNGLKAQTYGEPWAKNGSLGTLIPITGVIGITASFLVTSDKLST
jgi:hypothetical protein